MRIWIQETKQIIIDRWGHRSPVEIAEAVNLWHKQNAQANGTKKWPVTTDAGVMYQAAKLGYISQDEAEAYTRQRRKIRARKNYVPQKVRAAVLERDGHKCLLCGAGEDLTVNHIVPVTQGGTSTVDNLQTLCAACFRQAKGHSAVDFRQPYAREWCEHCRRYHYKNVAG